ncbi:Small GTPase superfamily, ARF/SAR type like protein [Aduncisulcus paluster]|uniref:Small GTPase superfamily, ARF/SAR type like protein n=1 Tax=Aduncisulcus paluster TaxID=2918883 RepID=A0ABQ5KVH1_9EUKA|nr:Small GTPase superfamily, ARF/SAR type like protein [Aduncisulcus paluster]
MGSLIAKLFKFKRDVNITLVGLDASGKTTALYKLKLGEATATQPTIGFNLETVEYKNLSFNVYDIGGQHKLRPMWHYYYSGADALIYMMDSSDLDDERLEEARASFYDMITSDKAAGVPVLVYANKQDVPHAISPEGVTRNLGLLKVHDRPWHVQGACARSGEGLYEGLEWLSAELKKQKKRSRK